MRSFPTAAKALLLLLLWTGCRDAPQSESDEAAAFDTSGADLRTGAMVLAERGFDLIAGRRVGLVVNHTAVVDTAHLVDRIAGTDGIELTALFGPEHGLRGDADAGEQIEDGRDARTGAPIYSLYGSTRKPTSAMLQDVDVLVFDIQGVGARFYTYISTMGLSMQAAAEQGIPFVVLDRPNPLGGAYVSGFMLEPGLESFVGQYPIPMAHGLTVGELAQMIVGEAMMEGLENLDLHVVEVEGWSRGMLWPETGLPWIAPSPNIPDFETALVYPGAVLFEATNASEGRGTLQPFKQLGAPWVDGEALADTLNARGLAGVRFEAIQFTPESIEGMDSSPKLEGILLEGIRYVVSDAGTFRPVAAGIHVLHAFYQQAARRGAGEFEIRPDRLARLAGTERLYEMLQQDASPEDIAASWESDVEQFRQARQAYLIY